LDSYYRKKGKDFVAIFFSDSRDFLHREKLDLICSGFLNEEEIYIGCTERILNRIYSTSPISLECIEKLLLMLFCKMYPLNSSSISYRCLPNHLWKHLFPDFPKYIEDQALDVSILTRQTPLGKFVYLQNFSVRAMYSAYSKMEYCLWMEKFVVNELKTFNVCCFPFTHIKTIFPKLEISQKEIVVDFMDKHKIIVSHDY